MDTHFEQESLEPPLFFLTEDWANTFGDEIVNSNIDTFGIESTGWMDSSYPELLNTIPLRLDLHEIECSERRLNKPQYSTSTFDNPCETYGPLPLCQWVGVTQCDSLALVEAPVNFGQYNAPSDATFSNPRQEQSGR